VAISTCVNPLQLFIFCAAYGPRRRENRSTQFNLLAGNLVTAENFYAFGRRFLVFFSADHARMRRNSNCSASASNDALAKIFDNFE